ncbi:Zn(II)2Cys6 transcription factor [Aspergillus aculeatinus CBS 121060]|uniref:C6 finger domain protein n=1 Tax=Aspergillus aculeatinus CBS 121060 TaxID=1448322 RepID=A0ACD1GVZ4_9EURO|nr:putative C6 finger domain protein [Aspergillus aculeatinus CBS 121060]RAH65310.1 putative C6 finger domain protein [Aspergillus aculeatinus CBS 121060]
MEHIKIPSPSAILDIQPSPPSTEGSSKPPSSSQRSTSSQPGASRDPNKPKQSKSRNGCITCKAKRLKCDESKPTCLQCKKRKVECGGYKKDFKWRPFEETNVGCKNVSTKSKKAISSPPGRKSSLDFSTSPDSQSTEGWSRTLSNSLPLFSPGSERSALALGFSKGDEPTPGRAKVDAVPKQHLFVPTDDLIGPLDIASLNDSILAPSLIEIPPLEPSSYISDVSLSNAGMQSRPTLGGVSQHDSPPRHHSFSFEALMEVENDDIEEIIRKSELPLGSTFLNSTECINSAQAKNTNLTPKILSEPNFSMVSPEMLVLQFDRFTCGILSVKDGAHENPWRTLIWPLAKETPALYHAVFSLAAFHSSKEIPSLRVHGMDHMRQSITYMVHDIQNMRADAALATSLALAFAETWDQHTRTCIQHLRGAKALVSQVVGFGLQSGMCGSDLDRIRFLYNTWLYMDVISRLTSREESGDQEVDTSVFQLPKDAVHEIDPLMGCATTLFPLIHQVARLIQRVRRTESNSLSIVSQAIELKTQVEQWEPPRCFEPPDDPTSEVQHSIQTAHAYRWATLLYLHQAVPEMPSEPASELSKRVLMLLATVPPSSRTTIIQMFPLLAAGCEAEQEEDRQWVLNRWLAIQSRLMLGSIDRCIEIVREVWDRRDAAGLEQPDYLPTKRLEIDKTTNVGRGSGERGFTSSFAEPWRRSSMADRVPSKGSSGKPRRTSAISPLENIEFDRTVRGNLHWVNVMQEWGWEVFLG